MPAKIKKGDRVIVTTGRDKGKKGEVMKVMAEENRALVSGVNMVKRHQTPDAEACRAASSPRNRRSICPTWRMSIRRTARPRASAGRY